MEVQPTLYETTEAGSVVMIFDVTPKVELIASTADSVASIVTDGTGKNAVSLGTQEIAKNTAVEVTLTLPSAFVSKLVYIAHKGLVISANADANGEITFTTQGFSPIGFYLSDPTAAQVGGNSYDTLQGAVNAAADGAVITLKKDCTESITVPNMNLTINCGTFTLDTTKISTDGTMTTSGTAGTDLKVTISKKSSGSSGGGGGGSSASTYAVSVGSVKNGSVTASPARAEEGDTVTLTVKPDSGYVLSALTVTDADGDEVRVKSAGDNKYTFTMPDSKVTVTATFVQEKEEETLPLTDVTADAYYYDAVVWAVQNGVTTGTTATTFSPNASCTRAQMVTFLWRAAGSPAPAGTQMPFSDVSEDAYYHDAVLWAVEQGITTGLTATTFGSDTVVTRGQTVTFLHRFAGKPGAETSNPFTDVDAGAYYAGAVQWAVENGITSGTTASTFSPSNPCTRAQIVTFLYRHMV